MKNNYRRFFYSDDENTVVKNDKPVNFRFHVDEEDVEGKIHRLFFKGESAMFYMWKSESDCVGQYICIEDSLNREKARHDRYCLDLSSEKDVVYRKTAYKKINWPPVISYLPSVGYYTPEWRWGIYATTHNLKIREGGFVRFTAEIYYKGEKEKDIALIPDEKYVISISDENCEYKEFFSDVTIDYEKTQCVAFLLEAEGYSGELYFEQPFLKGEKLPNLLPDFAPVMPMHEKFSWIGINLSKKEWPKFHIKLNDKTVFNGELFERAHRYSEFEFDLPEETLRTGENTLEIATGADYELPMRIKEVGYFVKNGADFQISSCPDIAYTGKKCKLLIKTNKENAVVEMEENKNFSAEKHVFEKAGLNVFEVIPKKNVLNAEIVLKSGENTDRCVIGKIIEKQDDGILTGSGDMIYINHEKEEDVESFLEWYISNQVGNMVTVRNAYRWGGGRRLNPAVWEKFKSLLEKLDIKYVHMVDGRDLPGAYTNPSLEMLKGENFLGRQGHEYDGQYGYWGALCLTGNPLKEATEELWGRVPRENVDIADLRDNNRNFVTKNGMNYLYKCPETETDMEKGAERFMKSVHLMKFNSTRHTGPATLFKYFYQAGYDWAGAELMYSSYEVTSAAIRGAAYGYGKKGFGAHLAVQWSTTPHDDEYRYRRFRLALYLTYMNGYNEINTEEGFWHLEEFYNAFSRTDEACISHLKQQQDFYNYMRINERKGDYHTTFAFVSGRFDGWNCFNPERVWGPQSFIYCDVEKSWDLLKKFYPHACTDSGQSLHPCPVESVGYYSGSPLGNIDILPVESGLDKLFKYKTLCFAGYNKFEDSDSDKLIDYMKNGGSVIIGWPHLSFTTNRKDVENTNLSVKENGLTKLICADVTDFETYISKNGEQIRVNRSVFANDGEILERTDDGTPLLIKKQIDKGTLWFINAMGYPADKAVKPLYEKAIEYCVDKNNSEEDVFVRCDNDVQFAIYKKKNGTDIYLLAVDWWSAQNHTAELLINQNKYNINVCFGAMIKVMVNDGIAAWIENENAIVTEVSAKHIKICGSGKQRLYVAKEGKISNYEVMFQDVSEKEITL